jgi:hypothetical protein
MRASLLKDETIDIKFFIWLSLASARRIFFFLAGAETLIIICGLVKPCAQEFASCYYALRWTTDSIIRAHEVTFFFA